MATPQRGAKHSVITAGIFDKGIATASLFETSGSAAVQTSPVQKPKDYNASLTDAVNQWWKLYQPLGFSIADGTTWLGTKAQLTSLCEEAENYGFKVIVDIVSNHVANNGTSGGGYSYVNSGVDSWLKNSAYYHSSPNGTNDDSRYNITQYHLGQPDLNTGNSTVQAKVLELLEECIDCGVDGFRFDTAKHIETPTDDSSFASQFWPTVINGAKSYAESIGADEPFIYGEILGSAGPDFDISNYTAYMAVTDNQSGTYVCFEYDNVEASKLNNSYALVIGGYEYQYSVMDYLRLARNKADADSDENLMNLVTSLYWYNVHADAYFGEE